MDEFLIEVAKELFVVCFKCEVELFANHFLRVGELDWIGYTLFLSCYGGD